MCLGLTAARWQVFRVITPATRVARFTRIAFTCSFVGTTLARISASTTFGRASTGRIAIGPITRTRGFAPSGSTIPITGSATATGGSNT